MFLFCQTPQRIDDQITDEPGTPGDERSSALSPLEEDQEDQPQEDEQITPENFMNYFITACSKPNQERGESQERSKGMFKSKCLSELSWRALLKKLFTDCEEMFTITCKCDDRKPKMTAQAVIKHKCISRVGVTAFFPSAHVDPGILTKGDKPQTVVPALLEVCEGDRTRVVVLE